MKHETNIATLKRGQSVLRGASQQILQLHLEIMSHGEIYSKSPLHNLQTFKAIMLQEASGLLLSELKQRCLPSEECKTVILSALITFWALEA